MEEVYHICLKGQDSQVSCLQILKSKQQKDWRWQLEILGPINQWWVYLLFISFLFYIPLPELSIPQNPEVDIRMNKKTPKIQFWLGKHKMGFLVLRKKVEICLNVINSFFPSPPPCPPYSVSLFMFSYTSVCRYLLDSSIGTATTEEPKTQKGKTFLFG